MQFRVKSYSIYDRRYGKGASFSIFNSPRTSYLEVIKDEPEPTTPELEKPIPKIIRIESLEPFESPHLLQRSDSSQTDTGTLMHAMQQDTLS
jgi:hypothetical protein